MSNARGKEIDNTHLSIDQAEDRGFIHRDYIAHCLRWSHVCKFLLRQHRYKTSHVLDIGCGKDQPLARMMYTNKMNPTSGSYTGVEYNKLEQHKMFHTGKFPITLIDQVAFPDVKLPLEKYDVIVCFEVLEHVEPQHAFDMMKGMLAALSDDGDVFVSTPCYDEHTGAAGNHVNEMTHTALGSMIEASGFEVKANYGTFASQKDYKKLLDENGMLELFNKLSEYYDSNYVSTIFAPMFPEHSRNSLWHLKKGTFTRFPLLSEVSDSSNSSSDKWGKFINDNK